MHRPGHGAHVDRSCPGGKEVGATRVNPGQALTWDRGCSAEAASATFHHAAGSAPKCRSVRKVEVLDPAFGAAQPEHTPGRLQSGEPKTEGGSAIIRSKAWLLSVVLCATALAACAGSAKPAASSASVPGATTTPTPSPSATNGLPGAQTAAQVGATLSAKIPQMKVTIVFKDATSDPDHLLGQPDSYTSKVGFADSRMDPNGVDQTNPGAMDLGGRIEVFPDAAEATARVHYLQAAWKKTPSLGFEEDFTHGGVVVRLTGLLGPAVAKDYQQVLGSL